MSTTPNYGWPLLATNQASPEVTHNEAITDIDQAFGSLLVKALPDSNYTLNISAVPSEASYLTYKFTGTLTADRNVIAPTNRKLYSVWNNTTSPYNIVFKTAGGSGITIPYSATAAYVLLYCDGTNIVSIGTQSGGGSGSPDIFLPESFGAVGDGTTDDTTAIQNAIAAAVSNNGGTVLFSDKTYLVSAALTVTASNIRLQGQTASSPATGGASGTIIESNSATANVIEIGNGGTQIHGASVVDLCVSRSVTPTSGNGIVINSAVSCDVTRVWIFDAIIGLYHQNAQFNRYTDVIVEWTTLSNSITGYGFKMVGTNTTGFFSTRMRDCIAINKASSTTLYGMHISTSSNGIADLFCEGFETAGVAYGVYIDGTSSNYNENLHFLRTIHDAITVSCFYITGVNGHDAYVEINGGYVSCIGSGAEIDIENSSGVVVTNVNFVALNAGTGPCVKINGSSAKGNVVQSNIMYCGASAQSMILLSGSTVSNNISNNIIAGLAASFTIGISCIASSNNTIDGNTLYGGGTTGISLDASSNKNGGVNVIDSASITTPLSASGTGNFVTISAAAGAGTVTHTAGALTLNTVILGNGSADVKAGAVLPGSASVYFDGSGNFSTPAGGGGSVASLFARKYYTTAQRAIGTVYQNTTGQPILVSGWVLGSNNNMQAITDSSPSPSTVVLDQWAASGFGANFMFVVAAGDYYEITLSGGTPISWIEYEIITGAVTASGDLSGSRSLSTAYQNTSGKAMLVLVDLSSVGAGTTVQGISDSGASPTDVVYQADGVASGSQTFWMMVPNNHYYKVTCSGASVAHWNEYTLPFNATKSIDYSVAPAQRKLQVNASAVVDGVNINGSVKDLFVSVCDQPSQTGSLIVDSGFSISMGLPFDETTMSNNGTNHSACAIFVMLGEFYSARQDAGTPTLNHWWEYLLS